MPPKSNKTHTTTASVESFTDKQASEEVRDGCRTLMRLMHALTGEEPHMYGPTIIGSGSCHYKYASGRQGDAPLAAFSPRKPNMTIYFAPVTFETEPKRMAKLGKHKTSKACPYVERLEDINVGVLKTLPKRYRLGQEDLSTDLGRLRWVCE